MKTCNCQWLSAMFGLALGLGAARAARADEPAKPVPAGDVTSFEFEDDSVHGDLRRPYGEILHARTRDERSSLVRARTHFIAELLEAAERL